MTKSSRCMKQYCQLCQSLLLSCGKTLLLFHGNQLGQSNFVWHNLVVVTSCNQQEHKINEFCMGQRIFVIPLQSTVLWHMGASTEWWRSSAWSTRFAWWLSLLSLLQSTKSIVAWRNYVNVASCNDVMKIFDQCICCNGSRRGTHFIAGAMTLYCNDEGLWLVQSILWQALWHLCDCHRLWPRCSLWQGACLCLAWCKRP